MLFSTYCAVTHDQMGQVQVGEVSDCRGKLSTHHDVLLCAAGRVVDDIAKDDARLSRGDFDIGRQSLRRLRGQRVRLRPLHHFQVAARVQLHRQILASGRRVRTVR